MSKVIEVAGYTLAGIAAVVITVLGVVGVLALALGISTLFFSVILFLLNAVAHYALGVAYMGFTKTCLFGLGCALVGTLVKALFN